MRAAPAVDYPVSQDGLWRRVPAALGGVLGAVPAAWAASLMALDLPLPDPALRSMFPSAAGAIHLWFGALFVGALVLPAAALGAWLGWRLSRVAPGSIHWDGGAWFRRAAAGSEAQAGWPEVALDWGHWLLLRWRPEVSAASGRRGGAVCIPLARRDLPAQWHLLRVALRNPEPRVDVASEPAGATGQREAAP